MSRPYFIFFFPTLLQPLLPNLPHFFFLFFIREGENETRRNREREREQEGKWGDLGSENKWGLCFSQRYRDKLHAMPHMDSSGCLVHLKATLLGFHWSRLTLSKTHTFSFCVNYFHTFLTPVSPNVSHHPTMCSLLSPPSNSLVPMSDRKRITPWVRETVLSLH